jgi:ketosteroid isomerase-like protein
MRALVPIVVVALTASTAALAHHGPHCDPHLKNRTPEEVLASHRAALAVGDWATVRCNYDDDAVVINDGGVTEGADDIVADLQFIASLIGTAVPVVVQQQVVSILSGDTHMARVLFTITTPCLDVPDGADTYVIKRGKIVAQTAHGFPVFKCLPPPG